MACKATWDTFPNESPHRKLAKVASLK